MTRLPAVILCGGRSARMGGQDKPLLDLAGEPIVGHVAERLRPQVDPVAINANGDPSRYAGYGLPVIADATTTFDGPLAGILAAMTWAAGFGASCVLTAAGDTPFFPANLAERLTAAAQGSMIAVASSVSGVHPTFALWPTALHDDLSECLEKGMRRVVDFIARHPACAVEFDPVVLPEGEFDPFFNVNTPDDLAQARRIAAWLAT